MLEWLLAPIDPSRPHVVGFAISWHGRMMVLAWGFLVPLGIVVARFCKITPQQDWPRELDNKAWWRGHLAFQYAGGVATVLALGLILLRPEVAKDSGPHRVVGWIVAGLATVQFLAGWLRGTKGGPTAPAPDGSWFGDHYEMTRRRILFEYVHKTTGYLLILLATAAILTGLWVANALVWIWVALAVWWSVLILGFARLQRSGYAVDTYQAIWGPDSRHPGNNLKPIGWGIRRRR